jgi:hypothetical protein
MGLILSIGLFEILYITISYKFGVFGETEKRVIGDFVKRLRP